MVKAITSIEFPAGVRIQEGSDKDLVILSEKLSEDHETIKEVLQQLAAAKLIKLGSKEKKLDRFVTGIVNHYMPRRERVTHEDFEIFMRGDAMQIVVNKPRIEAVKPPKQVIAPAEPESPNTTQTDKTPAETSQPEPQVSTEGMENKGSLAASETSVVPRMQEQYSTAEQLRAYLYADAQKMGLNGLLAEYDITREGPEKRRAFVIRLVLRNEQARPYVDEYFQTKIKPFDDLARMVVKTPAHGRTQMIITTSGRPQKFIDALNEHSPEWFDKDMNTTVLTLRKSDEEYVRNMQKRGR